MRTTIEMAREADIEWDLIDEDEGQVWYITKAGLERFSNLVRADERERIAQHFSDQNMGGVHTEWVAAAIRSRGSNT